MARFINSSCSPNCESQKWHDAATGEIRIGIFAAQDIPAGAELTYDYQFQHAGLAQDAGAYRCALIRGLWSCAVVCGTTQRGGMTRAWTPHAAAPGLMPQTAVFFGPKCGPASLPQPLDLSSPVSSPLCAQLV